VKSCTGDVANGSPIDTSTEGTKTSSVTAVDNADNEDTETHTYTVTKVGKSTSVEEGEAKEDPSLSSKKHCVRCPGSLIAPALFMPSEFLTGAQFPRTLFGDNSSRCIKTDVAEGHDHARSLPMPIPGGVLPSQPKRSVLPSLGLAAVCNGGRILKQDAA